MAQLFVQINKPFYFAGDTVQGHVYLNLFQNMNAHEVIIKFKGWQSVRWIEEHDVPQDQQNQIAHNMVWGNDIYVRMDSSDSEYSGDEYSDEFMNFNYVRRNGRVKRINRYSGGRLIAKFSSVLFNFGGNFIPAGQYSFPFSFKTGENYPASFLQRANDRTRKGRIKYEMQAFVRGFNKRRRLIKYKTEIVIRETTVIKNERKEMLAHVKSCCCIDKGTSKIQCFFDKNAYSPGENAVIHCILDTRESKAEVTRVTISLINKITYKSKENHQKVLQQTLFHYSFSGMAVGLEAERTQEVVILNQKSNNKTDIKPTARGNNLNSVYFLKVEAQLDASCTCCSELPIVNQDILIYPYIPINYTFNAPQSWMPKEMPMINLQNAISASNRNLNQMGNPYQ